MNPIKIFIGTSAFGEDYLAEKTLEFSLKKHTTVPLQIIFLRNIEEGVVGRFDQSNWATPFSGLRWTVPEACNFKGKAIYLDVDQLNFRDIAILYNTPLNGAPFACRKNKSCVTLFDCEKMAGVLPSIAEMRQNPFFHQNNYSALTRYGEPLDPRWNCLDGENYSSQDIWHLHFTDMRAQPWRPRWYKGPQIKHPRQDLVDLWEQYRIEAFKA
jgi:hypothetical protein